MEFEKWLKRRGYFPVARIANNYRNNGFSDSKIEEYIIDIKEDYSRWCSIEGIEPKFKEET